MLQWAVATAGALTEQSGDIATLHAFMWCGYQPACIFVVLTKVSWLFPIGPGELPTSLFFILFANSCFIERSFQFCEL
jgi:hypothetical protein